MFSIETWGDHPIRPLSPSAWSGVPPHLDSDNLPFCNVVLCFPSKKSVNRDHHLKGSKVPEGELPSGMWRVLFDPVDVNLFYFSPGNLDIKSKWSQYIQSHVCLLQVSVSMARLGQNLFSLALRRDVVRRMYIRK